MSVLYDKDADNTAVVVRTGSTRVNGVKVAQRKVTAPKLYLQLFDSVTVTPGTTKPDMVIPVPAGNSNYDVMAFKIAMSGMRAGVGFDTGLTYCVTTVSDGGTAPAAGDEPEVTIGYVPVG